VAESTLSVEKRILASCGRKLKTVTAVWCCCGEFAPEFWRKAWRQAIRGLCRDLAFHRDRPRAARPKAFCKREFVH
jgi:hypothetical protein